MFVVSSVHAYTIKRTSDWFTHQKTRVMFSILALHLGHLSPVLNLLLQSWQRQRCVESLWTNPITEGASRQITQTLSSLARGAPAAATAEGGLAAAAAAAAAANAAAIVAAAAELGPGRSRGLGEAAALPP